MAFSHRPNIEGTDEKSIEEAVSQGLPGKLRAACSEWKKKKRRTSTLRSMGRITGNERF